MIILDTDCLSLLDREKFVESSKLRSKLEDFSPDEIFTTIITFEEQMRGWMALLARGKTAEQQIYAYERLHKFLKSYQDTAILDFDEKAANILSQLKSQKIRIGTMDLKIASIVISRNAILVSRNLRDFEEVPNLTVEDWSK